LKTTMIIETGRNEQIQKEVEFNVTSMDSDN